MLEPFQLDKTHFNDFAFLIESALAAVEPPVQENDIKTSPKHRFGSKPDSDDSE